MKLEQHIAQQIKNLHYCDCMNTVHTETYLLILLNGRIRIELLLMLREKG